MVTPQCDGARRPNRRRKYVLAFLGFAGYMVEKTTPDEVMNRMLAIPVVWRSVLVILMRKGCGTRTF